MLGEELLEVDRLGVHVELAGEEADRLGQAADRVDVQPLDHGGLGGVGGGHEQAVAAFGGGLQGHREDALDRPRLAGEGQLADDGEVARPVEGHLAAAQEQPQGDRQVEAAGVLLQIGRGQVDDDAVEGRSVPELTMARSTRCVLSLTAASARPTSTVLGIDEAETSTSTSTGAASIPIRV